MHYNGGSNNKIIGILYRGDEKTKYSHPNEPMDHNFTRVDPYDFSLIQNIHNKEESGKFMLMQIDTDDDRKQVLPSLQSKSDLTNWRTTPERHQAYATLWKYLTFVGIVANTTLWLYF